MVCAAAVATIYAACGDRSDKKAKKLEEPEEPKKPEAQAHWLQSANSTYMPSRCGGSVGYDARRR